jgi:alternate signal-mediated exported protein
MSRKFKIAAGATVAAALLIGASATMAAWQVGGEVSAASFSVGFLDADDEDSMDVWHHVDSWRGDPAVVEYVVPGDAIYTEVGFVLTGQGDHLCVALDTAFLTDLLPTLQGVVWETPAVEILPDGADPETGWIALPAGGIIDMTCGELHEIGVRVRIEASFPRDEWNGNQALALADSVVTDFFDGADLNMLFQQQPIDDCAPATTP